MGAEGELRIALQLQGGRVQAVNIVSTRADIAQGLLQGRTPAEIGAALPLLFSICGHAQAAAGALACAAAAGEPLGAEQQLRLQSGVAGEMLREAALRTLMHWPQWLGRAATESETAAARLALTTTPTGAAHHAFTDPAQPSPRAAAYDTIAHAVFGTAAAQWLCIDNAAELWRWAEGSGCTAARFILQLGQEAAAQAAGAQSDTAGVALLSPADDAAFMRGIAHAAEADPAFCRQPTWQGQPAETGALARLHNDPLLVALAGEALPQLPQSKAAAALPIPAGAGRSAQDRVLLRSVARLRELALLLAGRAPPRLGALAQPGAAGVGWVETARGLLMHSVRLQQGGRAVSYRIIAPTEWNFHPQGALVQALRGTATAPFKHGGPDDHRSAILHSATRVVQSLDPCVQFRLELQQV